MKPNVFLYFVCHQDLWHTLHLLFLRNFFLKKSPLNLQSLHNILRLFDVSLNFSLTTNETMHDNCLKTLYIRVASQVAKWLKTYDLKKLGYIRKVSKF